MFLIFSYSNRSAALIKMGQFTRALQDAVKAKELNRSWPKVRGSCIGIAPTVESKLALFHCMSIISCPVGWHF